MKKSIILVLCLTLAACVTISKKPSICTTTDQPSYLCEVAEKHDMKLEDIGIILVIANAVAIGEGTYSVDDAIKVLDNLIEAVENPISYIFVKSEIKKYTMKYPGLFVVAEVYLDEFSNPQIMTKFDRAVLLSWFKARRRGLVVLK